MPDNTVKCLLIGQKNLSHIFTNILLNDIKGIAKWKLVELGVYSERSGITINEDESMNEDLKILLDPKKVNLQTLVLGKKEIDSILSKGNISRSVQSEEICVASEKCYKAYERSLKS